MASDRLKVLQFTQNVYQSIGIYPTALDQNRIALNWRNLSIIIPLSYYFFFTLLYFIFEVESIIEFGISFYAVTTLFGCLTYYLINMFSNQPKFRKLIGNFEDFIEKRVEYSSTSIDYIELIENIEKLSKISHFIFVKLSFVGIGASTLLITAINYYINDLNENAYYLPFPVLLPFNWKTPIGYLFAVIGSFLGIYAVLMDISPILSFFVGSCWLIVNLVKDVTNDLSQLNAQELSQMSHCELRKRFYYILQQISATKQCVADFNSIYKIIITCHFLWSLSNIGSTLLVLQMILSQPNPDPIEMITPSITMIWSFFLVFFYCESGELVLTQFDEFDEQLYHCDWYLFPIEMQRMLVIIMLNTQQPVLVRGLANAFCTREVFKKTTKCGFSYFMTMRQVDG